MPNANRIRSLTTLQSAVAVAADGTALNCEDATGAVVEISGTFSGITANFEASVDGGTTYHSVALLQLGSTSSAKVAAATATGHYRLSDAAGITQLRARTTVATPTGTMTVKAAATLV